MSHKKKLIKETDFAGAIQEMKYIEFLSGKNKSQRADQRNSNFKSVGYFFLEPFDVYSKLFSERLTLRFHDL